MHALGTTAAVRQLEAIRADLEAGAIEAYMAAFTCEWHEWSFCPHLRDPRWYARNSGEFL